MKGLRCASAAIVAAALFASSVVADLDPIVIKVRGPFQLINITSFLANHVDL